MAAAQKEIEETRSMMKSARGRMPSGKPNPVDVHVGNRVRLRRTLLGMSQEKLGESLGLTFQQVQKYERGANRIGASRLWDLSRVLDCPVSFFFEDMDNETQSASPRNLSVETPDLEPRDGDQMTKRETLELVRAYYKIRDYHVRRRIYELAKSLATTEDGAAE
jgi:transcriptional regulator with XRE-family HTH domain